MVRYKTRYLLFNILYPSAPTSDCPSYLEFCAPSDGVTQGDVSTLLRDSISLQFGDWGGGTVGNLSVKYFSPTTSTGIVRCSREHYRMLWAALSYIKEIKGRPCVFRVVKVSGTIKKVEQEAIRRARADIGRVQAETTSAELEIDDFGSEMDE